VTNFRIDWEAASKLIESSRRKEMLGKKQWLLDVILAPDYDDEAIDLLTVS